MLVHWIWFAHRPGVGDRMKAELLRHFSDPEEIRHARENSFREIPGMTDHALQGLMDKDLSTAETILEDCRRAKLQILTLGDSRYPRRLKNIPDPPMVLYYQGNLPDFEQIPCIGVVGTRKASSYGMTAARRLGYQIAGCGGAVVSGLASGIDGAAMGGALAAGGTVVGVLGCGADVVYPRSNRQLFESTMEYGCVLSEFSPGTPPNAWNFPRRNRIISGLSCGVLVVEAPQKSGALITAEQALEQGRDVFVVPGNIDVDTCVGSNRLLREGGIPVSTGWDILSEYQHLFPDKIRKDTGKTDLPTHATEPEKSTPQVAQNPQIPAEKSKLKENSDKKVIDKRLQSPYSDVNKTLPKLSEEERIILRAVGQRRLLDDVIAETGLPAQTVLPILTMLEVKGVIRRLPGRYIAPQ